MLFFELLQVALRHRKDLSRIPTERQWYELYAVAKKQALLGISFAAIEQLPAEQRPTRGLLVQWGLAASRIKKENEAQCQKIIHLAQAFQQAGLPGLVLKGQGVAQYYKVDNLDLYRTPGDVDLWVNSDRDKVIDYARDHQPDCAVVYHHVEFPRQDGLEIELHFTPSWMNNYFDNQTLQRYFDYQKCIQFAVKPSDKEIPTPSLSFNRVYILIHVYRHLFHTGIGFRQMLDYYYVLRQGMTDGERAEAMSVFASLGMIRFVRATMWVMQEVFGLEQHYMLSDPSEIDGRFLLEEMLQAGNFGQHDERMMHAKSESDISWGLRKVKRNFRFLRSYPSEVIWSPLFKIWHYCWRKKYV